MDFRFSQFEILTGAGTLLVCLYFICVFSEVSAIENDLSRALSEAVGSPDLYWSGIEVDGQLGTLTGSAPDVPAKEAAYERAQAVFGVVAIDNQIQVIGEAGSCQSDLDTFLDADKIMFKSGKAEVAEGSYHALGMLAMIIRKCETTLEIAGHTDAKGDANINLALSRRRAEVVAKHLARHGVAGNQMRTRGYGEAQPIADNSTDDGRRKNRRIEFRVIGDTA